MPEMLLNILPLTPTFRRTVCLLSFVGKHNFSIIPPLHSTKLIKYICCPLQLPPTISREHISKQIRMKLFRSLLWLAKRIERVYQKCLQQTFESYKNISLCIVMQLLSHYQNAKWLKVLGKMQCWRKALHLIENILLLGLAALDLISRRKPFLVSLK